MNSLFKMRSLFIYLPLIVLSFLYFPPTAYSQSQKEREKFSTVHRKQLKEGTLLIRLNTQARKIAILKKHGKQKVATKLEAKIKKRHKEIIAAFEAHYDFSNYCFYYEGDSKAIVKDRDFSKVIYNLETSNCPVDASKAVYLLLLESPRSAFLNQPSVFYFYEIIESGVVLMEHFPNRINTTKKKYILFGQVDDFPKAVRIINRFLR